MYSPLPFKELVNVKSHQRRIVLFDPTEVYSHITINKFERFQNISIEDIFPIRDEVCNCGCGLILEGRRFRWATEECKLFAQGVWGIIKGHPGFYKYSLMAYHEEWKCCRCGNNGDVQMDHIVPIMKGGGGCWLSNFQLLCKRCHKFKTSKDF